MTRISRGRSQGRNYCGHDEQTGNTWSEHNLEFTQMLYGGLDGSPYIRGIMEPINQQKVRQLFLLLQEMNPLLQQYSQPNVEIDMRCKALQRLVKAGETNPTATFVSDVS
jgi:hypothetical protein